LYGYVFVYLFGQQMSYITAISFSALAIFLIYPFKKIAHGLWIVVLISFLVWCIQSGIVHDRLYRFDNLLYRKYSPSGLVEVWKTDDNEAVEMTVNNVHEYYSYD